MIPKFKGIHFAATKQWPTVSYNKPVSPVPLYNQRPGHRLMVREALFVRIGDRLLANVFTDSVNVFGLGLLERLNKVRSFHKRIQC